MEFERIGEEIFVRSKPNMGHNVPLSARRICWPPPQSSWYGGQHPSLPNVDRPDILPLQVWKNFAEIKVGIPILPQTNFTSTLNINTHVIANIHVGLPTEIL